MGCDIHIFIEYKIPGGEWKADKHHVDEDGGHVRSVTATGRDYWLFGLLASVRTRGPREPRGLPDDVSPTIKQASDAWRSDAHSHSWISLEEFKKVLFEEYTELCKRAGEDNGCSKPYEPTTNTKAFYNYEDYPDWKSMPSPYTTLVAYCDELKEILNVDRIILDDKDINTPIQIRLVFFFDN